MVAEEKSIRIYDTKRTFFTKIGNTFSKLLTPTKVGINNMLISIKRATVVKNYKNMINAKENKKEALENKFEESYSLYLEAIDQLVIETVYKKVRQNSASEFEKDALSRYYNVIHLKEDDETEYKYKKQQYLLNLDYNLLKIDNKKISEDFNNLYIYKMDQSYKGVLKHYSIRLPERKMLPAQKEAMYNKIFDTLEEYVENIVSLKNIDDEELIKECSLFETYEVGKLDQVDILDKKMILLGISRKLFVHSLPLIVAEKCYLKLLKDTRNLIVDTKISRKRENAYQLLLRIMEQYNQKLLQVKIYWNNNEDKAKYNIFATKCNELEAKKEEIGLHEYDVRKQILYLREDMSYLENYKDKYYRIMKYYRNRLVNLGDMRQVSNSCTTIDYKVKGNIKKFKKEVIQDAAC